MSAGAVAVGRHILGRDEVDRDRWVIVVGVLLAYDVATNVFATVSEAPINDFVAHFKRELSVAWEVGA